MKRLRPYLPNTRTIAVDTLLAVVVVTVVSVVIAVVETMGSLSNVSNLYIIGVAGLASRRGLYPAVLASVLAFLAFDFFFIPPIHTFTVDDPSEYVALATLLVTSVLISQLLTLAKRRASEAQRRQTETQLLYEVSQAALSNPRVEGVYALALRRLNATLGLTWSQLLIREKSHFDQVAVCGTPPEVPDEPHLPRRVTDEARAIGIWRQAQNNVRIVHELDGDAWRIGWSGGGTLCEAYIPLSIQSCVEGVLVAGRPTGGALTAEEIGLLAAFANQLAIAVQRDRLADEQARARALEESNRLKSALVSSVSHELKTPLAVIKASATALLDEGASAGNGVTRELAESINREADRLTRLVGNLLDMSRLEAGALQVHPEWVSFSDVIADVLDRMAPILDNHPVSVQAPSDLPPTPMDFTLVSQVLTNLLDNAARYSPPGAAITISAEVVRDQLRVTVFNEGSYIPPRELERLFDKFYRLSSASGGTGLGLAIVRGIVEAHGGHVWAENLGQRGVAFSFTLPSPAPGGADSLPVHPPAASFL